MVSQNVITRRRTRQRRTQAQEQCAQALAAATQNTLNMVLWQIINEQAPVDEPVDEDAEAPAVHRFLTVPMEDIGLVPKTFALTIDPDPENGVIRIHAIVQKEKGNIILPDGGSLGGA